MNRTHLRSTYCTPINTLGRGFFSLSFDFRLFFKAVEPEMAGSAGLTYFSYMYKYKLCLIISTDRSLPRFFCLCFCFLGQGTGESSTKINALNSFLFEVPISDKCIKRKYIYGYLHNYITDKYGKYGEFGFGGPKANSIQLV